jgi:methionyl-tRNA formyltransferase
VGRHQVLTPPPIKELAVAAGIPVLQPAKVREAAACDEIAAQRPDVIVVMAYGQLLPQRLLDIPRVACINLHASLLPRHRGAACIQASIDAGDAETGMTVMHVGLKLDSGDLIHAVKTPIRPDDTGGSVHDRLAEMAPDALLDVLGQLRAGSAPRTPQDENQATYISKLGREDGQLDWSLPAARIERRIRAFDPWPGTFTSFRDHDSERRLKVFPFCEVVDHQGAPGEVLAVGHDDMVVACGELALRLAGVQADGARRMSAGDFARGARLAAGDRLGGS